MKPKCLKLAYSNPLSNLTYPGFGELSRAAHDEAFVGRAQQASHYKRLQRFFRHFELDETVVAKAVIALMSFDSQWVVCFDRTQWQFGQTTHNVLMLAVAHQGIAFPLLWTLLPKRGNSNTGERLDLVNQFLKLFSPQQIAYLTADRS